MKFSERIGKTAIRTTLQIESVDSALINRLWNCFTENFLAQISSQDLPYGKPSPKMQVSEYIWTDFFKQAVDKFPRSPMGNRSIGELVNYIREWFYSAEWYLIYDFVEFLSQIDKKGRLNTNFQNNCNHALIKELAGYRLIDDNVVQITSEEEIVAIEEALCNASKWNSVNQHLKAAIASLSEKNSVNYRNSVKESISAVEALCKIITGDEKSTLGKALSIIETEHKIHGALKNAFSAIYGYTSDSGGIRHSLLENDLPIDLDEAKFMLISCSAFINYLISKSN
jgi:hypothetical protein